MKYIGKDSTEEYEKKGHSKQTLEMAEKFYVGEFYEVYLFKVITGTCIQSVRDKQVIILHGQVHV